MCLLVFEKSDLKSNRLSVFCSRNGSSFLDNSFYEHGVEPLPGKIEAIENWPQPRCLKDVRAFVGLASYYRRFLLSFANIAEPLTRMTKKNTRFEWTYEADEAVRKLKTALMEVPILAFLHPNVPCILDTDASDAGL